MNVETDHDWLFDLGNTRLKFASLQADGLPGDVTAIAHGGRALQVDSLPEGRVACVSSVVSGALPEALVHALSGRFERVTIARTLTEFDGLRIAYDVPERLGVDRFLAMLAARQRAAGAVLVVGVGTALTIDLVDASGRHRGGRIAPSPALMREALARRAPHLPVEGGRFLPFASETRDALASGCEGAAVALVGQALSDASEMLGEQPALLWHGGGAPALQVDAGTGELVPALVLEGLARWANVHDGGVTTDA